VINIPNWEGFDRFLFNEHWHGFDAPRHLFVFPRAVISRMLLDAGFDIVGVFNSTSGYYAVVQSIYRSIRPIAPWGAKLVYRSLRFPGVRFLFEPFLSLLAILGRGPVITIVARKKNIQMSGNQMASRTTLASCGTRTNRRRAMRSLRNWDGPIPGHGDAPESASPARGTQPKLPLSSSLG
jgi:hypothetical protein